MAKCRHQFDQTNSRFRPGGITHKPTGASFTPYPGEPGSGNANDGQLGNVLPNGDDYRPHEVKEMMRQLWADYVAKNPDQFKTDR